MKAREQAGIVGIMRAQKIRAHRKVFDSRHHISQSFEHRPMFFARLVRHVCTIFPGYNMDNHRVVLSVSFTSDIYQTNRASAQAHRRDVAARETRGLLADNAPVLSRRLDAAKPCTSPQPALYER